MSSALDRNDPRDDLHLDEASVRTELTRVLDHCNSCRQCLDLCEVFPTLVSLIEQPLNSEAGDLTPAQQDQVTRSCHQCGLCRVGCPYTPELHEAGVDVVRVMQRAVAMQRAAGQIPVRVRIATRLAAGADLVGPCAVATAPVLNRVITADHGSLRRRVLSGITGISAQRLLPPFTRQRFSTWFRHHRRARGPIGPAQRRLTVFGDCAMEYHEPDIGREIVAVYERNGVECSVSRGRCCGAPLLLAGDVAGFAAAARRNLAIFAEEIDGGSEIVVAQPSCLLTIRTEYPRHVASADAEAIVGQFTSVVDHLMALADRQRLDLAFDDPIPTIAVYHRACHSRVLGMRTRELIELTGARVHEVSRCSGANGVWGWTGGREPSALSIAAEVGSEIAETADGSGRVVLIGDCHQGNIAIAEQTNSRPMHPVQFLARAYRVIDS